MRIKSKQIEKFVNDLYQFYVDHPEELLPMATDPQFAFDCLKDCFLGADYYSVNPICAQQTNTEFLCEILRRHSKEFRNLVKKKRLLNKQHKPLSKWLKLLLFILCGSIITGILCLGIILLIQWFVPRYWP